MDSLIHPWVISYSCDQATERSCGRMIQNTLLRTAEHQSILNIFKSQLITGIHMVNHAAWTKLQVTQAIIQSCNITTGCINNARTIFHRFHDCVWMLANIWMYFVHSNILYYIEPAEKPAKSGLLCYRGPLTPLLWRQSFHCTLETALWQQFFDSPFFLVASYWPHNY